MINRFLILALFIFISCEERIELDINSKGPRLVVEGYIQQDYPAYVFLTKSEGYFDPIDSNTINSISIDDANIYVERSDKVIHKLTYIDQTLIDSLNVPDSIEMLFKSLYIDLSYQNDNFSQIGYSYKLIVEWRGDTITADTYIPPQWSIDSIWLEPKDNSEYKFYIYAQVNDPDTFGNYASIFFKRDLGWKPMDPIFIPCAIPYRPDNITNGESFEAFFARSGRFDDDDGVLLPFYGDRIEDGQFVRKDIVLLRLAHFNKDVYTFWRDAERMQGSGGNPFSEPMNLSGNINGAYGIWGGYGVSYYYIPIISDTVIYDTYNDVKIFEIF